MRFDRGLRSAMLKPYPAGYTATPTDGFNGEKAECQTGGMRDSGVWLSEERALPSIIGIQVRLTPIWVDNDTALARCGESVACPLYPSQNVFCAVQIEATGTGHYQKASGEEKVPFIGTRFSGYRLVLPEPFLYQKNFQAQPEGRMIHQVSSEGETEGAPCLWAYGAQHVEDDIHPFVFTVESVRDETVLEISSLLFWRERGIDPCEDGLVFQDTFEEDQTRTLFESIEAGMSLVHLEVGVDETGQPLKIPYRSCQLSKNFIFYKKEA